jgi:multicomponent Na+:H+ antiporter subunit D
MATGTLNIADLQERLPALYHSKMVLAALAFFTVGLSLKLALFPLHAWLPGAYTHAPSVVSCIMAATATKVGVYAMLRIIFGVFRIEFDIHFIPIANILIVISSMAIIAGSALAVAQTNLKRMLAYSSVGQIGYIVLGAVLANQMAMTGSIIHILNHALMKGALFMVVGCIVYKTGIEDISGLRGMGKKMPFTMAVFTVAGLSMMGVPLTVGFVSKWYIAIGALHAGMGYLIPVIITGSLLSAVYVWRIIVNIYFPEELPEHKLQYADGGAETTDHKSQYSEAPWSMLGPTIALAVLCIYFGISATAPLHIAGKAAAMLLQ